MTCHEIVLAVPRIQHKLSLAIAFYFLEDQMDIQMTPSRSNLRSPQ